MNNDTNVGQPNSKYSKDFLNIALLVGLWMIAAYFYDAAPMYDNAPQAITFAFAGVATLIAFIIWILGKHPGPLLHVGMLTYDKMNDAQKKLTLESLPNMTYMMILLFASVINTTSAAIMPKEPAWMIFSLIFLVLMSYSLMISIKVRKAK